MTTMNENGKSVSCSIPKQNFSIDANDKINQVLNARSIKDVQNSTIDRIENCCSSMLSVCIQPGFLLPMLTIILMAIGILVVCLTSPKPASMF